MLGGRIKTALLLSTLTVLALTIGSLLGGYIGVVIAGVIVVLMNFGSLYFSDKIVLRIYKAQPAPKDSYLYASVKKLSAKAGLPMPKVYILPSSQPNAFATGRSPRHAAVAATEGLLHSMTHDEIDGVVAHELAHVKHYDTLITTIAATFAGIISYVAVMAQWAAIFGGFNRDDGGGPSILSFLLMVILAPIIASLLQLAVSRSREYLADAQAVKIIGSSAGLASALEKLERGTTAVPMKNGSPATGSMFIANPFRRVAFSELFSTHPPISKRVERLKNL